MTQEEKIMMVRKYPFVCLNGSDSFDGAAECLENGAIEIDTLVQSSHTYEFSKDLTFSDQGYFYKYS